MDDMTLRVIPTFPCKMCGIAAQSAIYEFFVSNWNDEFEHLNCSVNYSVDQFRRYDFVFSLEHSSTILGLICFGFHDLSLPFTRDSSLIDFFHQTDSETSIVLSAGGLIISPDFRDRANRHQICEILIGLSIKLTLESRAKAMVCLTRDDYKVTEKVLALGAEVISKNIHLHDCPSTSLIVKREHAVLSKDHEIEQKINNLWDRTNRSALSLSPFFSSSVSINKVA